MHPRVLEKKTRIQPPFLSETGTMKTCDKAGAGRGIPSLHGELGFLSQKIEKSDVDVKNWWNLKPFELLLLKSSLTIFGQLKSRAGTCPVHRDRLQVKFIPEQFAYSGFLILELAHFHIRRPIHRSIGDTRTSDQPKQPLPAPCASPEL